MSLAEWLIAGAACLAAVAVVVGVVLYRRAHRLVPPARTPLAPMRRARAVFVVNPTKPGIDQLRERASHVSALLGLGEPEWLFTTRENPGTTQARQAIAAGAGVVIAVGGDGTVRAVAQGLAGTDVPMGIVPLGTTNLLARNLDLPWHDPSACVALALAGTTKAIDVGRMRVTAADGQLVAKDAIFLVIGGVGFDAAMIDDATEDLKRRWKWIAYFLSGVRHLHSQRMTVSIGLDDAPLAETRARTVLVGNCGRLPAGLILLPDARLDDGRLDVARVDTRGGLIGWAYLLGQVVLQGLGLKSHMPYQAGRIEHQVAQRIRVRCERPEKVQVDGDVLGHGTELEAWVEPANLLIRA